MLLGKEKIAWNNSVKLIIADVDDTVSEVFKKVSPEMIKHLENLLEEGKFILFISGQSRTNIYNRLIRFINKKLLNNVLLGHCNGTEVLEFDNLGNIVEKPVFGISDYYDGEVNFDRCKVVIKEVLDSFGLEAIPYMDVNEFKLRTKGSPNFLMIDDRKVQIALDFVNGLTVDNIIYKQDIRIPIIKAVQEQFDKENIHIEANMAGTFAIDFNIRGVCKGLPIKNMINIGQAFNTMTPNKITVSNYEEIEIWGDSFSLSNGGSDYKMSKAFDNKVRAISFRDCDNSEENNVYNWNGKYRCNEGLLEYLKTRI